MRRSLAVLPLLAMLAPQPSAAADEPLPPGTAGRSGVVLALGIDYRYVWNTFYFYPSAYSETESTTTGLAAEVGWHFALGERFWVGPGAGVSASMGSGRFWSSGQFYAGGVSYSARSYRAEVFGEAGFDVVSSLALVARLGYGASFVSTKPAADTLTAGLGAVGALFRLSPRVGILALYGFSFAPGGSTDAAITSADPGFTNGRTRAAQARLVFTP